MSRIIAREYAYKLIFEYLFTKQRNERTFSVFAHSDLDENDIQYLDLVYTGVIEKYDDLMQTVNNYTHGFVLDRIYKPDIAALLLAIYEMKYVENIPLSVSINEAVSLVKKYSTDRSYSFVNGILSSVYKDLQGDGHGDH